MPYTLVQHSAVSTGHTAFLRGVETLFVSNKKVIAQIERLGGVLIADYKEAHEREFAENYPPGMDGLHPRVNGKFSRFYVDGQLLYIPAKQEVTSG